jgi:plasmid stabilization system protein ParE
MGNKVIFSSSAAKEIRDSFDWYEDRVNGLGEQFIQIIDLSLELILLNPEGFPVKKSPYREIVLKKFPYQIIYEYLKKEQIIYILHIFNTRRHPKLKYRKPN